MSDAPKQRTGGPFNRRPTDRRLVRQVIAKPRTPEYWIPMDLANVECKLMEVKKFSAHYFDLETKFRKPSLELISAFAVQNPYLWGQYSLRSEQMKMQLKGKEGVRERVLFYPVQYDQFEKIARLGFETKQSTENEIGNIFYVDSQHANDSLEDTDNVRMMFAARVLLGVCRDSEALKNNSELSDGSTDNLLQKFSSANAHGLPIDSWAFMNKNAFYKLNRNETYPDVILVYRDKTCPQETRSFDFPVHHIQKSLRSGTRYNPHEKRKKEEGKDKVKKTDKNNEIQTYANEEVAEIQVDDETDSTQDKTHIQMYTIKKEWTRK